MGSEFPQFLLERKILGNTKGYLGEAGRAQQPQQHRVDLGQCFTGDARAEEQSGAGISP